MKKAAAYKYHETFQNAMRMSMKMYLNTFRWILVAHLSLILFISVWWYKEPLSLFFYDIRPDPKQSKIFDPDYVKHFLP
jgi:hypothetical protein